MTSFDKSESPVLTLTIVKDIADVEPEIRQKKEEGLKYKGQEHLENGWFLLRFEKREV